MAYTYDKINRKGTSMSVIAAAVKLTLCENKLQPSFQESVIAYSLRVYRKTTFPKMRYIALSIVYIDHE